HFGRYRTIGYADDAAPPGADPMPAVRLEGTGARTDILIHPARPPKAKLFLASIGCLNPAAALTPDQDNDVWESRRRTIEIIDSLRAFSAASFVADESQPIPNAAVIIEGDP
ncbi:MAG: peptidase S8/S53 subtilisin kexin sedolisin, partial [Devosia sp.]